jgi:hypothetical protein
LLFWAATVNVAAAIFSFCEFSLSGTAFALLIKVKNSRYSKAKGRLLYSHPFKSIPSPLELLPSAIKIARPCSRHRICCLRIIPDSCSLPDCAVGLYALLTEASQDGRRPQDLET